MSAPWAMQLVARVEKLDPPTSTEIAQAAVLAVVGLLGDERASNDGEWAAAIESWQGNGRIRKLVRRARASAWERAQSPDGVTATAGRAEVRAYVPSPTDCVPEAVAKLQIQSTSLEEPAQISSLESLEQLRRHEPGQPMVIAVCPDVDMSWGKWSAQCAHGGQLLWQRSGDERPEEIAAWDRCGRPVSVIHPDRALWAMVLDRADVTVRDGGFTEIPAGTLTVAAFWL